MFCALALHRLVFVGDLSAKRSIFHVINTFYGAR